MEKATYKQGLRIMMLEYETVTAMSIRILYHGPADRKTIREEKLLPQAKLLVDKKETLNRVLIRNKFIPFRTLSIADSIEYSVKNPRNIYNYQTKDDEEILNDQA